MKNPILLIVLVFGLVSSVHAEEQTSKHRVIGLCFPSRVEDLREVVKTLPGVQLVEVNYDSTEVSFRSELTKLFTNYNPKKPPNADEITKHLDELLRSASTGTFTLKPVASIPADKLTKLEFDVGILDCDGCRYGVYLAIAKVEGVERATVGKEGLLTAWIDESKTNRGALEEALKKGRVELKVAK